MKNSYRVLSVVLALVLLSSLLAIPVFAEAGIAYPVNGNYFLAGGTVPGGWRCGYYGSDGSFYLSLGSPSRPVYSSKIIPKNPSCSAPSVFLPLFPDVSGGAYTTASYPIVFFPEQFTFYGNVSYSDTVNSAVVGFSISLDGGVTWFSSRDFTVSDKTYFFTIPVQFRSDRPCSGIRFRVDLASPLINGTFYLSCNNLSVATDDSHSVNGWYCSPTNASGGIVIPTKSNSVVAVGGKLVSVVGMGIPFDSSRPNYSGVDNLTIIGQSTNNDPLFPYQITGGLENSNVYNLTFTPSDTVDLSPANVHEWVYYTVPFRLSGLNLADVGVFSYSGSNTTQYANIVPREFDINYFACDTSAYDANNDSSYYGYNVSGTQWASSSYYSGDGKLHVESSYKNVDDGDIVVYNNDYNYDLSGNNVGVLTFRWSPAWGKPYIYISGIDAPSVGLKGIGLMGSSWSAFAPSSVLSSENQHLCDLLNRNFEDIISLLSYYGNSFNGSLITIDDTLWEAVDVLYSLSSTLQSNIEPTPDEASDFQDGKHRADTDIEDVGHFESDVKADIKSYEAQIPDLGMAFTALSASFSFVSDTLQRVFDSLGIVQVLYLAPLIFGLFFFICQRVPGVSRLEKRDNSKPKDTTNDNSNNDG